MADGGRLRKDIILSIFFTIITMISFGALVPYISGAGDANIEEFLHMNSHQSGFYFIAPELAAILRAVANQLHVNGWFWFSIIVIAAFSFFLFFSIFSAIKEKYTAIAFGIVFLLVFFEDILIEDINFTQTAVMCLWVGVFLLLHGFNQNLPLCEMVGGLITVFSSWIRYNVVFMILPYALMLLVWSSIIKFSLLVREQGCEKGDDVNLNSQEFNGGGIERHRYLRIELGKFVKQKRIYRTFCIFGLALVSIVTLRAIENTNGDLREYRIANADREYVFDYRERYPAYKAQEVLVENGIKESWYNMAMASITSDLNHFSSEDYEPILSLRGNSTYHFRDFLESLSDHMILWVSIGVLFAMILLYTGSFLSIIPILMNVVSFFLAGAAFTMMGRYAWRVTDGVVLSCAICSFLMALDIMSLNKKVNFVFARRIGFGIASGLAIITFLYHVPTKIMQGRISESIERSERIANVLEIINANKDNLYIDTDSSLRYYPYAHSVWEGRDFDYASNVVPIAGHFIIGMGDYLRDNYGIKDFYPCIETMPNIYVKYYDRVINLLVDYYEDYYEPVGVTYVGTVGDVPFCRMSKYMEPDAVIDCSFVVDSSRWNDDYIDIIENNDKISKLLCVSIERDSDFEYDSYYVNYCSANIKRSYGLRIEDNYIRGCIALEENKKYKDGKFYLIGVDSEGNKVELQDITDDME